MEFKDKMKNCRCGSEHTRLCVGQAQQCEANQPREDHRQPHQGGGAYGRGGGNQASDSAGGSSALI